MADSSYACYALLNACMITFLRLDARLFNTPPPQPTGKRGRKPKVGARQPTLLAHRQAHIKEGTQNRSSELFTGLLAQKVTNDLLPTNLWEHLEDQQVGVITLILSPPTLHKIGVLFLPEQPSWKDFIKERLPVNWILNFK